jgi:polyisoprenoid-binding protein YceI
MVTAVSARSRVATGRKLLKISFAAYALIAAPFAPVPISFKTTAQKDGPGTVFTDDGVRCVKKPLGSDLFLMFVPEETNMKRANLFVGLAVVLAVGMAAGAQSAQAPADIPVFKISPGESEVKFNVKASVAIEGNFSRWDAALTFTSTDVSTGVLDIKIDAASVNTGSSMKDNKLRSKDFFDVKNNPYITFHSNKIVQTDPITFEVPGTFTIRGVSKPETLTFTVSGKGTGSGEIKGTMAFDRKQYGMNSGIPFIKIADRVEVTVDLKGKRVSGPPLAFKQ